MDAQGDASFASALRQVLDDKGMTQAALAARLNIDPGQVNRWCKGKAIPHKDNILRIRDILEIDLSNSFAESKPVYELFVSTPISGLASEDIPQHHDAVATVVAAAKQHVNSLIWPGERIRTAADQRNDAADLVTEHNMTALYGCSAYLYLQFAEVVRPSSAFVELGFALARNLKVTIIVKHGLTGSNMLDNLRMAAANLSFMPNARMYTRASADDAASLIENNGRELLGLT
jgi:transcriptional regulator with XRE-family HTH domain